ARLQRLVRQLRQEVDERGRAVERQNRRRLLDERVIADAAALLVPRNVVAMYRRPHALDLRDDGVDDGCGQPPVEMDELVLFPVRRLHRRNVEPGERALDLGRHQRHRRLRHTASRRTHFGDSTRRVCYTDTPSAPRSSERAIRARRPSWDPFELPSSALVIAHRRWSRASITIVTPPRTASSLGSCTRGSPAITSATSNSPPPSTSTSARSARICRRRSPRRTPTRSS